MAIFATQCLFVRQSDATSLCYSSDTSCLHTSECHSDSRDEHESCSQFTLYASDFHLIKVMGRVDFVLCSHRTLSASSVKAKVKSET